jgi:hypothetical protein
MRHLQSGATFRQCVHLQVAYFISGPARSMPVHALTALRERTIM